VVLVNVQGVQSCAKWGPTFQRMLFKGAQLLINAFSRIYALLFMNIALLLLLNSIQ